MKKLLTLFATALMLLGVQNANAQTNEEYENALASIVDGAKYYITTDVSGTKYYLTTSGSLTNDIASAGQFTMTQITGGAYKTTAFKINNGTTYFTNPRNNANEGSLTEDNHLNTNTTDNPRADWDAQVLFLNSNGKYAVRATNATGGDTSGEWAYVAKAFWTVNSGPLAQYSFSVNYIWDFERIATYTVKAGTGVDTTGEGNIANIFDNNTSTKYCGNGGDGVYAVVEASEPVYVWAYEMTTANDNEAYGRCIKQWTLYGTSDATVAADPNSDSWVVLSDLGENSLVQQKNYYTQRFFCEKGVNRAFKYFKVVLNDTRFIQLSEFKILGETNRVIPYKWKASSQDNSKKAVDLLLNQKWEGSNLAGNWVTIETADGQEYAVKKYSFTTHDDGSFGDRAPKSWLIEGSNDNSTWTTIDDVTDGGITQASYTTFEYTPSNTTGTFKYIRLTLRQMKGTGWTQVGEFHVLSTSSVSDATYYSNLVAAAKATKANYESLLGSSDPWYAEYNTFFTGLNLDATLTAAKTSGDYSALEAKLAQIDNNEVAQVMVPFVNGSNYSAIDGSACWNDGNYSQLFDGNDGLEGRPGTKWGGNFSGNEGEEGHVQYVIFRVKSAFAPYFYKLVTGNDTHSQTGRNWKTWSVYGANFEHLADATPNSSSWVLLDKREDISEDYLPMESNYPAAFNFTEGVNEDYYYYMVKVFAAHNGGQIQMNEMYLCTQDEFETVLRAPLVDYFDDFDTTRSVESDFADELAEFNTKFAQLKSTDDAVRLTLLYNECVALRTQLETSMDYLDFYNEKAVNGVIQLATAEDLQDFSGLVNRGKTNIGAVLTADITAPTSYIPIGYPREYAYSGTFDGQGHAVTLSISGNNTFQGLFGYAAGGAVIQNVIARGSVSGYAYCAGILGGANFDDGVTGTITIRNCGNEADVTTSNINAAGIQGTNIAGRATFVITNCYNTGAIGGSTESAAISGYIGGTASTVTNCYNTGSVTGVDSETKSFVRGNPTYTNCYTTLEANTADGLTQSFDASKVASGELCYLLNGNTNDGTTWTQTIGTDANPIPFSTSQTVHQASPSGYTNLTVVDGKTQIADGATLKKFATEVNAGNTNVDAVLTDDINLNEIAWTPIGTEENKYTGVFDGAGKAITNFSYTSSGRGGLFGYIVDATVKDFSIDGTLTVTGGSSSGVIGKAGVEGTYDASVISDIHSSLTVDVTGSSVSHVGGVVGNAYGSININRCSFAGSMSVVAGNIDCFAGVVGYTYMNTIQNCANYGSVTYKQADCKAGGILGYMNNNGTAVKNCLNVGTVVYDGEGSPTYGGAIIGHLNNLYTPANLTNNYWLAGSGNGMSAGNVLSTETNPSVSSAQLASGEVAYKLNGSTCYEPNWFQTIGTDANPVLFNTHGIVNKVSSARYTTQYIPTTDVTIPEGVEVFAGVKNGDRLTLVPIEDAVSKEDAVIVRGNEGYYSFVPTASATKAESNALKGSDGSVTGDGSTIYALSKKNDIVGFYPVASTVTIPAGKAYLNTSETNVKGFFGFEEDDATGISLTPALSSREGEIFNLAGQRLSKTQKGINIINGKKILR